jgi:hypothetical protein
VLLLRVMNRNLDAVELVDRRVYDVSNCVAYLEGVSCAVIARQGASRCYYKIVDITDPFGEPFYRRGEFAPLGSDRLIGPHYV